MGSTQVKIPFFHQCIPLAEPSEQGGSILPLRPPQVLSVIEAKPVKLKDLLFLLAPPQDFLIFLRLCLYCLSLLFLKASLHVHQGRRNKGVDNCPLKPLQILTDLDAKTVQLYDFLLILPHPDLQTFRRVCTCS